MLNIYLLDISPVHVRIILKKKILKILKILLEYRKRTYFDLLLFWFLDTIQVWNYGYKLYYNKHRVANMKKFT